MPMPWPRIPRNPDVAIDLGTAMARVGIERAPTFAESPARVGTTPAVRNGAVVEPEIAASILRHLFRRYQQMGWRGSRALACAPSDATETELASLEGAIRLAGADEVFIVPEPLAAGIGGGADIAADFATMVIDFGEGVMDCAVICEGRIISSAAARGGCCAIREAVIKTLEREEGLVISESEAERIIRHVGLPAAQEGGSGVVLAHAHAVGGTLPRKHPLPATLIATTIEQAALRSLETAAEFVDEIEPRLLAEVFDSGVLLTGGGALIPGMPARFKEQLSLPIRVASAPLDSVINGAREMLGVVAEAGLWRG
jgi:rod shape-determining protein MreB and related proteins